MPVSLYDALVPGWLQTSRAIRAVLDKAEQHCKENDLPESALTLARLQDNMLPFSFQIRSVTCHSYRALVSLSEGVFSPIMTAPPQDFTSLKAMVDNAIAGLEQVSAEDLESFIGRDMVFSVPSKGLSIPFTAENYLFSFAQPNFYFHAATAYDILRAQGVAIGKADFLGQLRIKAD